MHVEKAASMFFYSAYPLRSSLHKRINQASCACYHTDFAQHPTLRIALIVYVSRIAAVNQYNYINLQIMPPALSPAGIRTPSVEPLSHQT